MKGEITSLLTFISQQQLLSNYIVLKTANAKTVSFKNFMAQISIGYAMYC